MRFSVIFIICILLQINKGTVSAQSTNLNLNFDNASLGSVLDAIENQSGYNFAYSVEFIDIKTKVSINISSANIHIVLDRLFKDIGIKYEVIEKQIILLPGDRSQNQPLNRIITGTVRDNKSRPLPGVVVNIEGTTIGVFTDENGKFLLKLPQPPNESIVVFSFLGMVTQKIKLNNLTTLNITLQNSTIDLEELVVVGYGIQKKASLVGAISQVSPIELLQSSTANLKNSLAGHMAGIITVMGSGKPGDDDSRIYVRGMGTVNDTDPLVLVDGIEREWNQIDATDIESLSVLKDASATAVFGVRGANGVILIATKRGQNGKPVFNITSRTTIQTPIQLPEYLGSYQFALLTNEALRNEGKPEEYTRNDLEHYRLGDSPYTHPDNDYYKDFLKKTALQQNVNMNATGGTDFFLYYLSASILHQEGLYKEFRNSEYSTNANYDRYNFRSNLDFNITPTVKLGLDLNGRLEKRSQPNFDSDLFDKTRRLPPNYQSYINPNGTIGGRSDETRLSPYALLAFYGNRKRTNNVLEGSIKLDKELDILIKGLLFHAMVGFSNNLESKIDISEKPELWQYDRYGVYKINKQTKEITYITGKGPANRSLSTELSLNYNRIFYQDHAVTGMVLYQSSRFWDQFDVPIGYLGFVGRTTYGYKSRYLFEFDMGYNGSMQFAKSHRYGIFPALSLGWVISDESWWKNQIPFIDHLKLRGSYGEVGNDKIGDFKCLYEQRFNLMPDEDGWNIKWGESGETTERGIIEGQPGNENVTWERAKKSNIGFDAKLVNSRLSITTDFFHEHRTDILSIPYSTPLVFGMNNPQNSERTDQQGLPPENIGIVTNEGIDTEIGFTGKIRNLNYFIKGNLTFARNKIIHMDEEGKKYEWQKREGKRIGQHFGLTDIGLYQKEDFKLDNTGSILMEDGYPVLRQGIPVPNFGVVYPGDCKYADLNGDGLIDSYDMGNIGHGSVPEYTFGFTMGASFRSFDLSILFQGAGNADIYLRDDAVWEFNQMGKVMKQHLGRYNPEDPSSWATATYPLLHPAENPNNHQKTSRWLFSRNYFRLKNVELGYNMPQRMIRKFGLSGIRIFASGNNLFTLDKIMNWDPESGSENGSQYPQLRLWNLGISVNF